MKAAKKEKRLQERIKDYENTLARYSDAAVQSRKKNGGYRCPGSRKR